MMEVEDMKLYNAKNESAAKNAIALDDMILTKDLPTTAGSRMLDGYTSLFNAEVVDRLLASSYEIAGKASVGEFAFDLMGESAYGGAFVTASFFLPRTSWLHQTKRKRQSPLT